ncbi:MAG: hypothetical protein A2048_10135 [Deltaproteobacteria bacterium GWA2_45_12]|nr:MAG: hypothetical protein A2048_10135 [Deltaproteobacteria bacterium GWA2_45_12]
MDSRDQKLVLKDGDIITLGHEPPFVFRSPFEKMNQSEEIALATTLLKPEGTTINIGHAQAKVTQEDPWALTLEWTGGEAIVIVKKENKTKIVLNSSGKKEVLQEGDSVKMGNRKFFLYKRLIQPMPSYFIESCVKAVSNPGQRVGGFNEKPYYGIRYQAGRGYSLINGQPTGNTLTVDYYDMVILRDGEEPVLLKPGKEECIPFDAVIKIGKQYFKFTKPFDEMPEAMGAALIGAAVDNKASVAIDAGPSQGSISYDAESNPVLTWKNGEPLHVINNRDRRALNAEKPTHILVDGDLIQYGPGQYYRFINPISLMPLWMTGWLIYAYDQPHTPFKKSIGGSTYEFFYSPENGKGLGIRLEKGELEVFDSGSKRQVPAGETVFLRLGRIYKIGGQLIQFGFPIRNMPAWLRSLSDFDRYIYPHSHGLHYDGGVHFQVKREKEGFNLRISSETHDGSGKVIYIFHPGGRIEVLKSSDRQVYVGPGTWVKFGKAKAFKIPTPQTTGQQEARGPNQQGKKTHQRPTRKDLDPYYYVLGIARDASQADIKKTFLRLMQENHPDRFAHQGKEAERAAKERTQCIAEAYVEICEANGWSVK